MQFCPGSEQVEDIFTNPFTKQNYVSLRDIIGVRDTSFVSCGVLGYMINYKLRDILIFSIFPTI
jgi:hypothetical protein